MTLEGAPDFDAMLSGRPREVQKKSERRLVSVWSVYVDCDDFRGLRMHLRVIWEMNRSIVLFAIIPWNHEKILTSHGKKKIETRIWRSMPWIESSVRRETRISKIWFGGSITKILLRQTSEHRTKTSSCLGERSSRADHRLQWLYNRDFFLWFWRYFVFSSSIFPNFWSKFQKIVR